MPHRLKKSRRHPEDTYANVRPSLTNATSWKEEEFANFTHFQSSDWIVSTPSQTESEESRRISRFQLPLEPEDWTKSRLVPNFPSDEDGYRTFGIITSRDSEPQDDYNGLKFRATKRENDIVKTIDRLIWSLYGPKSFLLLEVELTPTQILRRWTTIVNLSGLKREGEKVTVTPDAVNDTEALHAAAHYMTEKFGQSVGTYEKWRQWFLPVCHPVRRRQNILRRFEIEYRVNVQDYERAMRPIAKTIRRNIRQLLHKEYAPVNNRIWHEKLGQVLIQQSRVDLTDHMKRLEEHERQRQMELLQKGVIKQDIYDQVATTRVAAKHKVRRRKHGKKKDDPASNLLAHLDAFNTTAVAPNLDELNDCQRDLTQLEASMETVKGEVASDEQRWQDWVTNEEVSSQDSGRIHEDAPAPPAPNDMKELYKRAHKVLNTPCFVKKKVSTKPPSPKRGHR
ncbi:unnamed protein product [Taenia asiatica]|uniref:Similar to n=1 Tax=Taenia asiatica TaxID=60517 RepID=A0A0R3WDJ6_TAEAS|nr:unnamed protein product [Taenia asiatica]